MSQRIAGRRRYYTESDRVVAFAAGAGVACAGIIAVAWAVVAVLA